MSLMEPSKLSSFINVDEYFSIYSDSWLIKNHVKCSYLCMMAIIFDYAVRYFAVWQLAKKSFMKIQYIDRE